MELIDVLDSAGNKTKIMKTKPEVHQEGLWHNSVHIWFVNSKKEILLQFRSKFMDNNPSMWDVSVAGHVSSGESLTQAVIRELKEEINFDLNPAELKFIGKVKIQSVQKEGTYINNEFNYLYLIRKDLNISDLHLQAEEVTEIKWLPIPELKQWVQEKRADLVPHAQEYEILFKELEAI